MILLIGLVFAVNVAFPYKELLNMHAAQGLYMHCLFCSRVTFVAQWTKANKRRTKKQQ